MDVSLLASYLETLNVGDHTLTTTFDDGDPVSVTFSIQEAPSSSDDGSGNAGAASTQSRTSTPHTGDSAFMAMWVVLALAILGAVLCERSIHARRS